MDATNVEVACLYIYIHIYIYIYIYRERERERGRERCLFNPLDGDESGCMCACMYKYAFTHL